MRLLFSFPDRLKTNAIANQLLAAHIACDVRGLPAEGQPLRAPSYPEVWIRNDTDFPAAVRVLSNALASF